MPNKALNPNYQFQNLRDYNLGFDIGIWDFNWHWNFVHLASSAAVLESRLVGMLLERSGPRAQRASDEFFQFPVQAPITLPITRITIDIKAHHYYC